jgi:tetratricopeptide (TPR) repeat protein
MNNPAFAGLDQTELVQLALNAGSSGDAGVAIAYLKEAVARPDATAIAHFLLGAEYAQSRLYEHAVDEMEAAIALDPALAIGRLQLGLLLTCMNEGGRAQLVLEPLQALGEEDSARLFGAGLVFLIENRLSDALARLEAGIERNQQNPALNTDMRRLADEIAKVVTQAPVDEAETASDAQEETDGRHMLLSAYMGNSMH